MTTIICIGDSITEGIGSSAPEKFSYPAQMQKILGKNFDVINCGRNGATLMPPASGSNDQYRFQPQFRLALDSARAAAKNGDEIILSIMLGTNDGDVASYGQTLKGDAFFQKYRGTFLDEFFYLIDAIQSISPDVSVIISKSPYSYDNIKHNGYGNLKEIWKFQQETFEICRKRGIKTVLNDLSKVTSPEQINGEDGILKYYSDRLHPNDAGYLYLAKFFCEAVRRLQQL